MGIRLVDVTAVAIALAAGVLAGAQVSREAPAGAPATGVLSPAAEPGDRLNVSGVIVGPDGTSVAGASIYAYQTDREGYYGVKPASDNRNPRLFLLLRSGARGEWSFETIRPGSYPGSRVPGHIHFEIAATGFAPKVFEIVFVGDPFITDAMRQNPAFSVRPIEPAARAGAPSRVTERIVLAPR
jgi:protocatechuate 3,4-dioxygenase beta subunit